MASLSSWYNSQYSAWNRTRRLRVTPYLARTDTMTSRTATAMANRTQGAIIGISAAGGNTSSNAGSNKTKDSKKQEALFGPNIGVVSSGPAWTDNKEKKVKTEELTPEVVQSWIARSKQSTQPTTTLQALVNLKRPTLRLSPLDMSPQDDPAHADSHHHHSLEFEYDCDAPKCGIYVHVLLSPEHRLAEHAAGQSSVLVFETVVDGGFGRILKLEDGATLELGRFENKPHESASVSSIPPPVTAATSVDGELQPVEELVSTSSREATTRTTSTADNKRSRFSTFHFRRRTQSRSVSGPALAVVDAEAAHSGNRKDNGKDEHGREGVKVTIRLAALDEQGTELALPNEQVTYLHVVRFGPASSENQEDARSWVVKVVKREATIGPHTFHLHEIYGLTSTTSHPVVPTTPGPANTDSHTYPPLPAAAASTHHVTEDEPSSECLLCLSSPREVVLLPCRHLVACKECALNMVEFGAGGSITQPEADVTAPTAVEAETPPAPGDGGDAPVEAAVTTPAAVPAAATGEDTPTPVSVPTTTPTPATPATAATTVVTNTARRKRKAKGWFCPVCRQPYTSLLRITTTSPVKDPDNRASLSLTEQPAPVASSEDPSPATNVTPPPPIVIRGGLSAFRPAFLRNFSRTPGAVPDLERGVASA